MPSVFPQTQIYFVFFDEKFAGMEVRVSKCRVQGGQQPHTFFHDWFKILSKICKKCKFWFVSAKFEL
jgi:hypothetical protein